MHKSKKKEIATIGGGCFWCIEAIIQRLKGVEKVTSGFAGGTVPGTPTYREVSSGLTGHAEVIQVEFNSNEISYIDLLTVFLTSHDPTTQNRQGANVGTQYRSVIFYHNQEQQKVAESIIDTLANYFNQPIVTEITPLSHFFAAENEHQDYFNQNKEAGYCQAVITPKLSKLHTVYGDMLKA